MWDAMTLIEHQEKGRGTGGSPAKVPVGAQCQEAAAGHGMWKRGRSHAAISLHTF